ncbi:hypothetical protein [Lutibaculum baratangense]|uniref:Secreted protein n=1 Tax=Lutibaculum baratangense AMV1 TaxID=631454 RepID=V4T896_9HYPH|nr:hypothetical protein [Lutibaculum baratangense]ESR22808.1 hypothetical protein N177_3945 [Lutibaculum baratangense AMV1]
MKRLIRRLICVAPLPVLLAAAAPPELPPSLFVQASGSCAHAAAEAARQGGEVIGSPQLTNRGGQQVCVVTILIRKPGSPPVRRQIVVPAR